MLVSREVRAKYKGSSLGIVWSLVKPVTLLLIYFVAIGQFLGAARSIPDFAIFVFTGLTIWGLYAEIVVSGTHSIINNAGLVKKVYLPREVFPLASVGAAFVNFLIQFAVLILATVVLWRFPLNINLLYVPLAIALTLTFGTALGILFSALNVSLRDVQHLVEVLLLLLFWASPIVYSIGFVHKVVGGTIWEQIYLANPITLAVVGMQKGLWLSGQTDPSQYWPDFLWLRMLVALGISLCLLFGAHLIFKKLSGNFAQEL
jgi:ABC-2 type transport system permease protein